MLDLGLPDLDGLQLARLIRDEPRWRTLPIVALSSRTSPLDIVRGAAAGCDAYLGKPVGYGDLQRTVVGQLRRAMGTDALPPGLRALTA
jgi:DNA-binding response OmpR family regulator